MVNTLSHLGIGLLIASVAGLNSRQIKIVAFMAILPDLDFILNALLLAIDQDLSHRAYNSLYYFFGHREFMHSILFASLVTLYIWFKEKNGILTLASGAAIFSHIYLDYVTSWKMRPFFPFVTDSSTIGAIDFFDPVVTIISFIPIVYILAEHAKKNGYLKDGNNWLSGLSKGKHEIFYRNLLIVFTIWCLLNPVAKALLIDHIEETEGHNIGYQGSYPISPGKFLSAYSYNDSYYRIFTSSYWSGIENAAFVRKYPNNEGEFIEYLSKAEILYGNSLPGEIDYPVYDVSTYGNNVTVTLSDARNPLAQYWAYFKTDYVFVFDEDTGNYQVYIKRNGQYGKPVPMNLFE
ncbi:metal-dependent hydrolase [Methanolobus mangrovi]|uniref:Metal-dependent hydrolase n=1 Tax=Methanolobus mangrovi TaxID=3072977 RepID=A0AA51YJW6_9EURY|nr:metal-dependent hydrolase [Methanolobus mangrovi]WMW22579.1 metal-dependent hydrolase [Methanolobus mangrovi]